MIFVVHTCAQRFALPALGRGQRSRPTRKMLRREKLLARSGAHAKRPSVRCIMPGGIVPEGDLPEWDRPGRFVGLRPFTLEQLLFL